MTFNKNREAKQPIKENKVQFDENGKDGRPDKGKEPCQRYKDNEKGALYPGSHPLKPVSSLGLYRPYHIIQYNTPITIKLGENRYITILSHCEVEGPNYIHPSRRYSLSTILFFEELQFS